MDIILLERVPKLGAMGEVVKVRDGFARNFLLRQGKALRATDANKAKFERERAMLEARNAERRAAAGEEAKSLDGKSFTLIRQAGESGQLYGSVSPRDIAEAAAAAGVDRRPQPHPAAVADQDHRPLQGHRLAASGSRSDRSPSTSPARPKKPQPSRVARISPARSPTAPKSAPPPKPSSKKPRPTPQPKTTPDPIGNEIRTGRALRGPFFLGHGATRRNLSDCCSSTTQFLR